MPRIRYTLEEKENALRLCEEFGVQKASQETGISTNSLYKWRAGDLDVNDASENLTEEATEWQRDTSSTGIATGKRYTAKEREAALRLCAEIGVSKASKQTGISTHSLYKWRAGANEAVEADQPPVIQADLSEKDPAPNLAAMETPTTQAEAPTTVMMDEKHGRSAPSYMYTDQETIEELIRLRMENVALKAQMTALKNALRAFTE